MGLAKTRETRDRSVLLYAHPSMDGLAKAIVSSCDELKMNVSTYQRQQIPNSSSDTSLGIRRSVIYKHDGIKWQKFQDGFPNLFIEDVKNVTGRDVIFLGSFHSPEVIFEQVSVAYAMPRYMARSFTFILPYFPTGTMERVDTEGQVATAKTLADLLSLIPMTSRGPPQIVIFDIHALQERFYFSNTVIPRLESAVPLLQQKLASLPDAGSISIAFPDDGAYKRFHMYFDGEAVVVCNKVRDGDKRIVKVKEGDVKDRHVVILDDLIQTGGTLVGCAKALKSAGAKCVSAYVTHAVFPNDSWRRFVDTKDVCFQNFWITDSIPHATEISHHPPFQMLSLGPVIADVLLRHDLKNP